MASLSSRSIVLIFARLSNYAVLLLSPLFLVRILDIETYGLYREFTLYALLSVTIFSFGIKGNLLYFIPKDEANEKTYVSNSIYLIFITSLIGLLLIQVFSTPIASKLSFDYIDIMSMYIFFYLNLDIIESFWLAKKRSNYVFLYSTTVLTARMLVVIITAYITRNIHDIIFFMTVAEALKFSILAFWWGFKQKISFRFNTTFARKQLTYIAPLGIGGLIAAINLKFGSIYISTMIGATALAIYSIGIYQIPVLAIVRSAVSDVIFPDMVEMNESSEKKALHLWKRANTLFCIIVFPVFTVFMVFAEKFITIMFTEQYIDSTPIFQLMLILMVRRCFELGTPLRSKNKNKYFFRGNIIALTINIIITIALFEKYKLLAPAIAYVISDFIMAGYLTLKILTIYRIRLGELILWRKIILIAIASIVALPLLIYANTTNSFILILSMISVYCIIYIILIKIFNIDDANLLFKKLMSKFKKRPVM
ncbi:MAG TPA: oligosaccharide flippase family protein [Gammaproteobacteria bacterium]